MVVIAAPSTSDTGVMQERIGLPSTCTVQAPQAATPQPNLVPVIFRCSRSTHRGGVSPSTPTSLRWPLTVKATMTSSLLCRTGFAGVVVLIVTRIAPPGPRQRVRAERGPMTGAAWPDEARRNPRLQPLFQE